MASFSVVKRPKDLVPSQANWSKRWKWQIRVVRVMDLFRLGSSRHDLAYSIVQGTVSKFNLVNSSRPSWYQSSLSPAVHLRKQKLVWWRATVACSLCWQNLWVNLEALKRLSSMPTRTYRQAFLEYASTPNIKTRKNNLSNPVRNKNPGNLFRSAPENSQSMKAKLSHQGLLKRATSSFLRA